MIISRIRNSRVTKGVSLSILLCLLAQLAAPISSYAVTGGPSQPEVEAFTPVSSSDMVDLFTGDFSYNLPLLDVGGYPVNISYNGNVGMDEDASWVGLGWNINPGTITRNMRGIPDDFKNEEVIIKDKLKNNVTFGLELNPFKQFLSKKTTINSVSAKTQWNYTLYLNNYTGLGYSVSYGSSNNKGSFSIGYGSADGFDVDGGLNLKGWAATAPQEMEIGKEYKFGAFSLGVGLGVNSRSGLKQLTINTSYSRNTVITNKNKDKSLEMRQTKKAFNGDAQMLFNNPTYTPAVTPDYASFGINASFTTTTELIGFSKGTRKGMNFTVQGIPEWRRTRNMKAIGTMYMPDASAYGAQEGEHESDLMMDFNRTGGSFDQENLYMGTANITYDILNVTGQGVGGTYRPHLSSIGSVYDPRSVTRVSPSLGGGLKFGKGAYTEGGFQAEASFSWGHSGRWEEGNGLYNYLKFQDAGNDGIYEPVYLKNAGEKTRTNVDFMNAVGGEHAVKARLKKREVISTTIHSAFQSHHDEDIPVTNVVKRSSRDKRNQVIQKLTNAQAREYGLLKSDESHFAESYRKDHHTGELTVVNPDGTRYVYGIAAYNRKQKEVTFAMGVMNTDRSMGNPSSPQPGDGLVSYTATDASMANEKGIDHYYHSEEVPAYAHSYLLSAVLSSDYVDITGDGPTPDDMGSYTYFTYDRKYDDFKWRAPYTEDERMANLQLGLLSRNMDDKANYVYGEKEIWYLSSIKTKTHIAIFNTSVREDGLEAKGEDGGIADPGLRRHLYKLDNIELYTITERDRALAASTTPKPLKKVVFTYGDELCANTPNSLASDGKKLTLKQIAITYGSSNLGALSPYVFEYFSGENYDYHRASYDRWGNYKPASGVSNSEFPYATQDPGDADAYARAWKLKSIKLPSGGKIEVDYESDDYAYVQDRKAMEMIKVVGLAKTKTDLSYNNLLYKLSESNNVIVFDRNDHAISEFVDNDMGYLYFNFLTNVQSVGPLDEQWEHIHGYGEIEKDSFGVWPADPSLGYVKLKGVRMGPRDGEEKLSPIAKAAFDFSRTYFKDIVYPGSTNMEDNPSLREVIGQILGIVQELGRSVSGHNKFQMSMLRSQEVNVDKSWVRLYSPGGCKKGGGSRVKSVKLSNDWSDITDSEESTHTYGQKYIYHSVDGRSFGVASYEPMLGQEENPWRRPHFQYEIREQILRDKISRYNEVPIGEELYPYPVVGYSCVRVENLKPADVPESGTLKRHGTGYTLNHFYTAKDFPVVTDRTHLDKDIRRQQYFKLLGFSLEYHTASQGTAIELNDMHGKPHKVETFGEFSAADAPISRTTYEYYTNGRNRLENKVTVINKDGSVEKDVTIGMDMDFTVDPREARDYGAGASFESEVDVFMAGITVAAVGFNMNANFRSHITRSVTATKVIHKYGILKKVTVMNDGSSITTENVAFDPETGEVLLTKTENEHSDHVYNLTYPAHWAYEGMGNAYVNIGALLDVDLIDSKVDLTGEYNQYMINYMFPGDELMIESGPVTEKRVWVLDKKDNILTFIDENGDKLTTDGTYKFRVLRSGRRNMQTMAISTLVLKSDPINHSTLQLTGFTSSDTVINASGITFKDHWQTYRNDAGCYSIGEDGCSGLTRDIYLESCTSSTTVCDACELCIRGRRTSNVNQESESYHKPFPVKGEKINPYVWGILGNWRPDTTFTYFEREEPYVSRKLDLGGTVNETDSRRDGFIEGFIPFWKYVTSVGWRTATERIPVGQRNPWLASSYSKQVGPEGVPAEAQDAMFIPSSAQFSYLNKLPVAAASNAQLRDILSESFEDYDAYTELLDCDMTPGCGSGNGAEFFESLRTNPLFTAMLNAPMHWYIWPWFFHNNSTGKGFYVDNEVSHTGKNSIVVWGLETAIEIDISDKTSTPVTHPCTSYVAQQADFIDKFSPEPKDYILSYWVKRSGSQGEIKITDAVGTQCTTVNINSASGSKKIEGWERVSKKVTIDPGTTKIKVVFSKGSETGKIYFDDLRISPLKGSIKTFVYDKHTKRLMAILDENNYATFYEYDEAGNLVRTKRETERGIVTIGENRQNIKH